MPEMAPYHTLPTPSLTQIEGNPPCHIAIWDEQLPYEIVWQAMQTYTNERGADSPDHIWLLQHPPVFTQGLAGKPEHILQQSNIPIVQTDRGGQVTYHGPGQVVGYFMLDLRRLGLTVGKLVTALEETIVAYLAHYDIQAYGDKKARGVYVDGAKICAIGLRVRRGCSYHGIAFNIAMDLAPYQLINPCGYSRLPITQLKTLGGPDTVTQVNREIPALLLAHLGYNAPTLAK